MSSKNTATTNGGSMDAVNQSNIPSDIALLSSILNRSTDPSDETDIAELLRQIETAHGVAEGVETRLDGVIDHLDALLDTLETHSSQSTEGSNAESKLQDDKTNKGQQG
ncbi:hypothetical protein QCA50_002384 [Cerrena zonata]|uniref:Uncharacterized protein n=1 Tax=Cerrena zonata TaxID=2478898 RepID=A0AAW0GVF4_9APHY